MIDCHQLSEYWITLTMYSPGGGDQPLRGRQWHPSLPPNPPPPVHLPQPVTAGVNLSICASLSCILQTQARANASPDCGCMCACSQKRRRHIDAHVAQAVVLPKDSVSLGLLCLTCAKLSARD